MHGQTVCPFQLQPETKGRKEKREGNSKVGSQSRRKGKDVEIEDESDGQTSVHQRIVYLQNQPASRYRSVKEKLQWSKKADSGGETNLPESQ
ncbi:unnamed protein product [Arabis nemorensis]|uniref:Uncharacterized protein n=1 Tax=Arabis nemorensis TaxID=586526 RepID=A0A565B8S5_9BRAS|nr:unnamed protein product [Arabis nemorensis]